MTIQNFLQKIIKDLKSVKIPHLESEAREIFCNIFKKDWGYILAYPEKNITRRQQEKINTIIKRRLKGEPLAYILGHKNFYGLEFEVNKSTLIPRPETELMVEKALDLLRSMLRSSPPVIPAPKPESSEDSKKSSLTKNTSSHPTTTCIDVGTGSGCIIASLAKNIKNENIKFIGFDISQKALQVARRNIDKHNLKNKIALKKSDLLENLLNKNSKFIGNSNILILANLPYLSRRIYREASNSVTSFEPRKALLSDKDGLDHYRKLLDQIKTLQIILLSPPLRKGRVREGLINSKNYKLFFEISPEQKNLIKKEILQRFPNAKIKFHQDLAQKWRLVEIKLL